MHLQRLPRVITRGDSWWMERGWGRRGEGRFEVGEWGNKRRGKPEPWCRQRHIRSCRTQECP